MRLISFSITICIVISFCDISAPVFANESKSPIASQLDSLYETRSYDELEKFALRTLIFADSMKISDRALLHKYLGLFYIIKEREVEGKRQFKQWLHLDSAGYVDRFNYPPMIVRVYKEVKSEIELDANLNQSPTDTKWKPDASGMIKSALVPGWGQLIQHKNRKALTFFGAQVFTSAGWIISNHNLVIANTNYQRETDAGKFDELYDRTNNWNYTRWVFAMSSIAVYVLSQTDFYLIQPQINLSSYQNAIPSQEHVNFVFETSDIQCVQLLTIHF